MWIHGGIWEFNIDNEYYGLVEGIWHELLCNLFFELPNEVRLRILLKLVKKAMKLAHLSEKQGLNGTGIYTHTTEKEQSCELERKS